MESAGEQAAMKHLHTLANSLDISATVNVTVVRFHERVAAAAGNIFATATGADDHTAWAGAIALCGTSCEVAAGYVLTTLVAQSGIGAAPKQSAGAISDAQALLSSRDTVNLYVRRQRKLWHTMTGSRITHSWTDWADYGDFIRLRNSVVHTGLHNGNLLTQTAAQDALHLTQSFHGYLKSVMTGIGLASFV